MQTKKVAWLISAVASISILLYLFILLNVIGSEYTILIRWISTISLMISGVLVGMLISEKKIPVKTALIDFGLVAFTFLLVPVVGYISITVVNMLPLTVEVKILITSVASVSSGLLYMGLLFQYKRKKHSTDWLTD
jgi:hypothetical protein